MTFCGPRIWHLTFPSGLELALHLRRDEGLRFYLRRPRYELGAGYVGGLVWAWLVDWSVDKLIANAGEPLLLRRRGLPSEWEYSLTAAQTAELAVTWDAWLEARR